MNCLRESQIIKITVSNFLCVSHGIRCGTTQLPMRTTGVCVDVDVPLRYLIFNVWGWAVMGCRTLGKVNNDNIHDSMGPDG